MTIYPDDLTRFTHQFVGFSTVAFAAYDSIAGSGITSGLNLLACGVSVVYTVGRGQDYLRRRDTRVVAYLSENPGTPLTKISAATKLSEETVASSLQRLVADGLVVRESGATPPTRSYSLTR
ncbi:winged helix-turn-helix transcriptional regulator [Streptomyces sp. SID4985]|uniref:winged helix-turn-helix domain-containing protein n=1 Tax=Streptomyces sp. SID4985 TaxID=2690292 RepID=UPI0013682295|nr:winged helix-turn-helix domain-containing protein [Streptomyces sp. SID4985]MYQ48739.1 winged helix-turn-helix transcriptional regulator [Streptomyces sp. SID4985]